MMYGAYLRKKQRTAKRRITLFFAVFFACIFSFFLFLEYHVNPIIMDIAESQSRSNATIINNNAVIDVINANPNAIDFLNIERDKDNNVTLLSTDAIKVNQLLRKIVAKVQEEFGGFADSGIDVALGTMSGITALTDKGPKMNINILSIDEVWADFSSNLTSSGINQTKYSFYSNITTKVVIVLASNTSIIEIQSQVLLFEGIIVGKVPTYILGWNNGNLNLVP